MLLEKSILTAFISFIIYFISLLFLNKKNKLTLKYGICFTLMYVYAVLVFHITILPLPLDKSGVESLSMFVTGNYINIIPFKDISGYGWFSFFRQIVGNIIMFMPYGFLLQSITKNTQNIKTVAISAFKVSLLIETLQLIICTFIIKAPFRIFDINDLIMNTFGAIVGYIMYKNLKILFLDKYNKNVD